MSGLDPGNFEAEPTRPSVVAVGGSWGALQPLLVVLAALAQVADKPPVLVVLHRSPHGSEGMLEGVIANRIGWKPTAVEDKDVVVPGELYVAPADYHLLVDRTAAEWQLSLSTDAPVRHSRPSVDVLFGSVADAYGAATLAVVLSGASDDGAKGAREIREYGGRVLVQEPASAEAPVMPSAVIAAGAADFVATPDQLAAEVVRLLGGAA